MKKNYVLIYEAFSCLVLVTSSASVAFQNNLNIAQGGLSQLKVCFTQEHILKARLCNSIKLHHDVHL